MAGGFVDSYYYFLKYTMKEGMLMGLYMFITGMGIMTEEADTKDKVQFISQWIFSEWGGAWEGSYYKVSKNIWVFGFDDTVGVCTLSESTQCMVLKYYWMFIMTLNVFLTFPLSVVAHVYSVYKGHELRFTTVAGWF